MGTARTSLFIALFAAAIFFVSRTAISPARLDNFEYSNLPPKFVWDFVLPALEAFRGRVLKIDPPMFFLFRDLFGAQMPHVLYALTRTEIMDRILDKNAPVSVRELARESGVDADVLYRLLRRAAVAGYFVEYPGESNDGDLLSHRFDLTPYSHILTKKHPLSARYMLLHQVEDIIPGYSGILHELKNGVGANTAFHRAHNIPPTESIWDNYMTKADTSYNFNIAMEHLDAVGSVAHAVDFPWSKYCDVVVDVGGGKGRLLRNILERHPNISGILFDLEQPIKESRDVWNVLDIQRRVKFVSGSFFDKNTIPKSDGERRHCYTLRAILHDWSDEDCVKILTVVASAMRKNDYLTLVEITPNEMETLPRAAAVDINMMVFGGKERTPKQFEKLLKSAGFANFEAIVDTRSAHKVAVAKLK